MSPSAKLALVLLLAGGTCVFWLVPGRERSPTPEPPAPQHRSDDGITGCVRARGLPVAGARVRLKGTTASTLTDNEGRFRLPFADSGRVTAWQDGFLIAGSRLGTSALDLRLTPLPAEDHEDYAWVDPTPDPGRSGNCANCHAAIYREWADSGHSRSASGPHFRNLYEGTNAAGEANVGWGLLTQYSLGADVCASCHAPAIPDDAAAARDDLRKLSGVATHGVHCDYCHKIADVRGGAVGLTHGRFNLRLLRPGLASGGCEPPESAQGAHAPRSVKSEQLFFGPLDDVDRGEDAFSPLYHESRYCASCHEGVVFGVRVYSTYSEWLDSPARREGKQCQDCHMTPTGTMTNIAPGRGGVERDPQTLGNHRFFAPDRDAMLRRSVHIETDALRSAEGVRLTVRIGAVNVGHRVPTGFIDRHVILVVEPTGADGKPVAGMEGPRLPPAAGPELSGRPGRLFAKLLTGRDGKAPAPFWLAGGEPVDNRLTPGGIEEIVWRFPSETTRLRVRVLYRRFWNEVARSKGWPDRDTVIHDLALLPK